MDPLNELINKLKKIQESFNAAFTEKELAEIKNNKLDENPKLKEKFNQTFMRAETLTISANNAFEDAPKDDLIKAHDLMKSFNLPRNPVLNDIINSPAFQAQYKNLFAFKDQDSAPKEPGSGPTPNQPTEPNQSEPRNALLLRFKMMPRPQPKAQPKAEPRLGLMPTLRR